MKITKAYLKQIIKEEVNKVNNKEKAVKEASETYGPDIVFVLKDDTVNVYFDRDGPDSKASRKVKLGDSYFDNRTKLFRAARKVLEDTDMEPEKT